MKISKHIKVLSLAGMISVFAANAFSQSGEPLSFHNLSAASQTSELTLSALNNDMLRSRTIQQQSTSGVGATPVRFAEPRSVAISPDQWVVVAASLSNGTSQNMAVWRKTIRSVGAESINLGFERFHMPEGGSLHIYSPGGENLIRPFTSADNEEHGQLWTPMIAGDEVVIEVNVPSHKVNSLELKLSSVNHGFIGSTPSDIMEFVLKSGSCNVDVVCPDGDGWRDQIRSVAAYSTGGSAFCTGGAVNNTANDGRGFFLTADHCGINAGNAPSMVLYWNYQNSTCRAPGSTASGGRGDGQKNQFSTGAIFRAGYSSTDMTLVELDDPIDPAFNVYLAGWNATSTVPSSATGIHHPNVQEKRISHRNGPLRGGPTHLTVPDWDIGTTEPGSSGSPLFDQDKRVVGQLTGGSAACGNNGSDIYGWVYRSWTGGGNASSRLSNWLDAAGTGDLLVDGREASGSAPPPPPPTPAPTPVVTPTPAPPQATPTPVPQPTPAPATPVPTPVPGGPSVLQNGTPISGLNGQQNSEMVYTVNVPQGASSLSIRMSGGTGDADLYVKFGSKPSLNDFQCRPFLPGNNETCTISNVQAGTYYIVVQAYSAYTNASVVASFQQGSGNGGSGANSNTNVSVSQGQWFRHAIEVPPGVSKLVVTTSGGTGDADLYVRQSAEPNGQSYDCRSWGQNNNETCSVDVTAGTVHVGIIAYTTASGITETWRFE